jgi:succinate dehydrogenase/fumarate reductase-like Fe-S protein
MTVTERKRLQTETGVTGVSFLFELYSLYAFDPVKDMVIDRMHLTFNMLKREFIDQMWVDMGINSDIPINDRDPTVCWWPH